MFSQAIKFIYLALPSARRICGLLLIAAASLCSAIRAYRLRNQRGLPNGG